jgi:hypothetical protein
MSRMNGAIPPLSHMPARYAEGQLYSTSCVNDQELKAKISTFIQSSY